MFDLGDDIILDSYRIPWLIWIQFLIMFLLTLTILLSFFGLDSSSNNTDSLSLISSSHLGSPSNCSQTVLVAGNRNVRMMEVDTIADSRSVEHNAERDDSYAKALASAPNAERLYHPCRFFDLAKQAFLKCLGLNSSYPDSPDKEHEHGD